MQLNHYSIGNCLLDGSYAVKIKDVKEKVLRHEGCEVCKSSFMNEVHSPAVFVPDTPVPVVVASPARQTQILPAGLEVRRSSIPDSGLQVFNKGERVPVHVHFEPCQRELVNRDEAMNNAYSWVISKSRQSEACIDTRNKTNANWMRHVNRAPNEEEQNLVVFLYQEGSPQRSCPPIKPEQGLLMWYNEEHAKDLNTTMDCLREKRSSDNEMNDTLIQVYSCSLCPLSYPSKIYLNKHMMLRHYEQFAEQQKAGQIKDDDDDDKKKEKNLKATEGSTSQQISSCSAFQGQNQEGFYRCSECWKSFTYLHSLREHQHIHTKNRETEKPHDSSQCGVTLKSPSSFSQHQLFHKGQKPFQCSESGKQYSTNTCQYSVQHHKSAHIGEKPFHGPQFEKSHAPQSTLQQHQHTREKSYLWPQSGMSFTCRNSLEQPQLVQKGVEPYSGSQCGKSFNHQSDLQKHQSIHRGKKLYQCSLCDKSYARNSGLRRHERYHRPGNFNYSGTVNTFNWPNTETEAVKP